MAGKPYLGKTMLRRLFACLALLTGLAAAGAPAQATLMGELEQLEISAERGEKDKSVASPCEQRRQEQRRNGEKPAPCLQERGVRVYIPSVMFGADRAFE